MTSKLPSLDSLLWGSNSHTKKKKKKEKKLLSNIRITNIKWAQTIVFFILMILDYDERAPVIMGAILSIQPGSATPPDCQVRPAGDDIYALGIHAPGMATPADTTMRTRPQSVKTGVIGSIFFGAAPC